MADIKVRDLTDTSSVALDNQIMVLINDEQNQVQNITVENLLTNVLSSDNGNVLEQGTDGKLYVETPENITGDLADLSTINKTSLVNAINEVDSDITDEATTRANADNNLQSQIDAITSASDVTDIVGTYAQLQAYDTTGLPDNSIIKVLQDESRQDETTYYRWVITGGVGAWVLIGEEGPYYTKSQADSLFATQQTTGNLASLDTSDKTSLVNAINELSSVLDPTQTADYINNSKAVESGAISSNSIILSNVIKYAHSSFDRSKFTVVGSPNITDDGVASGFSSGNYIKASITTVSSTSTFEIKIKFKFSEIPSTWTKIWGIGSGDYSQVYITSGGITFNWAVNGTNYNSVISHLFTGTEDVTYTFGWNGTQVYSRANINGLDHTGSSANLATSMSFSEIYFANVGTTGAAFTGQIDLKQFSITVDGVEVFSGNKTGIDTIKPDDYTVVGTPTISADGVASGLNNSSNKINQLIDVSGFYNHNLRFTSRGIVQKGKRTIFFNFAPTYNDTTLCLYCETNTFILNGQYLKTDDTTGTIWCSTGSTIYNNLFTDDNPHWCIATGEFNVSANTYTITLTREDDGQSISVSRTITDAKDNNASPRYFNGLTTATVYIGNNHWTDESDTIDLNAFKIYVDGNLVYQPCLKIPYTESKTGSKIVNATYRDRVNDMADQFGSANYYTLDEDNGNFTLPMGELYGMIENKVDKQNLVEVPAVIISTYQNGTSWYNVYSNGFCEQGGYHSTISTSNTWVKVSLLKTYKDKSYSAIAVNSGDTTNTAQVKVGNSSKNDVDGFYICVSASSGAFWRTSGYLAEGEY